MHPTLSLSLACFGLSLSLSTGHRVGQSHSISCALSLARLHVLFLSVLHCRSLTWSATGRAHASQLATEGPQRGLTASLASSARSGWISPPDAATTIRAAAAAVSAAAPAFSAGVAAAIRIERRNSNNVRHSSSSNRHQGVAVTGHQIQVSRHQQ